MGASVIRVALDAGRHAPGAVVKGSVVVTETVGARSLYAAVRCVEHSPDYAVAVTDIPPVTLAEGELAAGSGYAFVLTLPGDALPTLRSTHGRILWEVVAWVDKPGRDARARAEFEVAAPAAV